MTPGVGVGTVRGVITLDLSNPWLYLGPALFIALHVAWKAVWYEMCDECKAVVPRGGLMWLHRNWHQEMRSKVERAMYP